MRFQRGFTIVFIAIMLITTAVPSMTVHAQEIPDDNCEGSGVFYWPCRVIESLLSAVRNFFNWVLNTVAGFFNFIRGVFEWIFTAVGNVFSFIGGIFQAIFDFIGQIFALIVELIEIVVLVVQIIVAFVKLLGAWLFQAVGIVIGFLNDFFTTTPTAFPGAPQCMSAPTSHHLCSIWYLFDNTVWGGSVGAFIVAVILILIDVPIMFIFIKKVLSYLRMGESVTDVG